MIFIFFSIFDSYTRGILPVERPIPVLRTILSTNLKLEEASEVRGRPGAPEYGKESLGSEKIVYPSLEIFHLFLNRVTTKLFYSNRRKELFFFFLYFDNNG